jgi:hypothetical protein
MAKVVTNNKSLTKENLLDILKIRFQTYDSIGKHFKYSEGYCDALLDIINIIQPPKQELSYEDCDITKLINLDPK